MEPKFETHSQHSDAAPGWLRRDAGGAIYGDDGALARADSDHPDRSPAGAIAHYNHRALAAALGDRAGRFAHYNHRALAHAVGDRAGRPPAGTTAYACQR